MMNRRSRGRSFVSWCLMLLSFPCLGDALSVEIKEHMPENLLKNATFKQFDSNRIPKGWTFKNMSQRNGIQGEVGNSIFRIDTSGNHYGYLEYSGIPVTEGTKYYASVELRLSSKALLWLETPQYYDGKSALTHPRSATKLYSILDPAHGQQLYRELINFLPEECLRQISDQEFKRCDMEFVVPAGHDISTYTFRVGSYGGSEGWIEIRNPFFVEAGRKFSISVNGKGAKELLVKDANGRSIATHHLQPNCVSQTIDVLLTSSKDVFTVEVSGLDGRSITKEL